MLFSVDYTLDCQHVEIIRHDISRLVENIDSKISGLLEELYAREVIDRDEFEDLKEIGPNNRRNERLLSILERKSFAQFQQFLEALVKTGQHHIVFQYKGECFNARANQQ